MSGVQPSPSVTGCFAVEERHQLAVPPHRRLAAGERVARPRARRVEVVAGEQGSAARCRDDGRSRGSNGPAPHGTEHSRWVKNDIDVGLS